MRFSTVPGEWFQVLKWIALHPFVTMRRLLCVGPAMIGRCLFVSFLFLGWGKDAAVRAWNDTK